MPTRRTFLKTGLAGGVILVLAGLAYGPPAGEPAYRPPPLKALDPAAATIVAAIAPVMLGPAVAGIDRAVLQAAMVNGVDVAVSGLPAATRAEIARLFSLLDNRVARRWLAGVKSAWLAAGPAEIGAFLHRWQHSRLVLLRSAYQGLHQLIYAAWYGNPLSWPHIGYDGPPLPVLAAKGGA